MPNYKILVLKNQKPCPKIVQPRKKLRRGFHKVWKLHEIGNSKSCSNFHLCCRCEIMLMLMIGAVFQYKCHWFEAFLCNMLMVVMEVSTFFFNVNMADIFKNNIFLLGIIFFFGSLLGLEPATFHIPTPAPCHLSWALRAIFKNNIFTWHWPGLEGLVDFPCFYLVWLSAWSFYKIPLWHAIFSLS